MHITFASALRQLAVATCASLLLAGAAHAAAIKADTKPEAGTFKMGMQPWLGYGQWYVAEQAGAFKANGLEQVELVNFTEDKDMNAALASGQIDGGNLATHTAMAMVAAGLPVKIVLLLDQSTSADALIVDPSIKTLTDLKGKQVAYEEGTTSDILLHSALRKAGLTLADVQPVPMPAANAGSALIAGQVPAAVTYEPYLSAAKQQNPKVNLLYKGSDDPGIISDVFVVRDEVLKERPGQVLALIKSWEAGLKHYNEKSAPRPRRHRQGRGRRRVRAEQRLRRRALLLGEGEPGRAERLLPERLVRAHPEGRQRSRHPPAAGHPGTGHRRALRRGPLTL